MFRENGHTFVICAYRESEYLEECIRSLRAQSRKSRIAAVTSTPNAHIENLCKKYGVDLHVNNTDRHGIDGDWNFALSIARTPLVTIAHQDDVYRPRYTENMLACMNAAKNPLLYFCNYCELRDGKQMRSNMLLRVKRLLLLPLRLHLPGSLRAVKRLTLAFGNPICCPSCTFYLPALRLPLFEPGFETDLDWQAWEKLSRVPGAFTYCPEVLMCHRIHAESETSRLIENSVRTEEDLAMFAKFWPLPVAKMLNRFYVGAQKSNRL